jgi:hypothetical protein
MFIIYREVFFTMAVDLLKMVIYQSKLGPLGEGMGQD